MGHSTWQPSMAPLNTKSCKMVAEAVELPSQTIDPIDENGQRAIRIAYLFAPFLRRPIRFRTANWPLLHEMAESHNME